MMHATVLYYICPYVECKKSQVGRLVDSRLPGPEAIDVI